MTANKLSFKVYLVNEDPWTCTEVRRFGIDADVATNFIYLREKLQTIFPDLRGKRFNVTWKDDENESITISTDEELEIALHEMAKNMICKLYIMLQSEQEIIDMSKIEKIQHPGVICDVCDKAICGFRFKCMQCADYDLCIDCMTLGNHTEHYMVRMTQPIVWSSYHARRLAHHVRKFVKKAAYHYKEDERKCNEPHKNKSKRGSCPVFNADDENQERKRTKEQYREPSAEAATEATEDSQQEATRHSFSQLLKIVEDNISNISQFLDPLGINVTVMADNDSSNKKSADSTQKANTQKPETRASTSSEDSAKKFPGEGKKLRNDPVNTAATPLENAQKDSITAAAVASPTASATATSAEQAAEAEEWTMIQRESPSISRTSSTSSSNGTLPKQATPFAPTAPVPEPEKSSSNQKIYPPLPEEVKNEFYHPNPKIQNAVEAMMAMGFTNEGSWLTHLLIAQNGDIDKALDVIHPIRRH
ncbi:PREDICTED: sequestosome-1 isoform X3 [Trachymyrmex septentrionalis]|uniref:sequestosome-1 isoform X3 n=1 Tax=Trachymyrmex septentrionalis TaxID=34720 RepID=UPI00084F3F99|nr:PREDICTED: sequestosome-1 isoform X3 [Trachymyrmex septentrionalis]